MGNALTSKLLKKNPELAAALTAANAHKDLTASLTLANVLSITTILWSFNIITDDESDKLTSLTASRKAAKKLLKLIFTRGDKAIKGFTVALEDIDKPELAEKLRSVAAVNPMNKTPATEESAQSNDDTATDIGGYEQLSENLRRNMEHIASQLTTGQTDSVIVKLRSHKEKYLVVLDYEEIKAIATALRKATELIDKLLKNERAIPYFAKSLKDVGRPDLCDLIRNGRATSTDSGRANSA